MKLIPALVLVSMVLSCQKSLHNGQDSSSKTLADHIGKSLECQVILYELHSDFTYSEVFKAPTATFDLSNKLATNGFYYTSDQGDLLTLYYGGAENAFSKMDSFSNKLKSEDAGILSIISAWGGDFESRANNIFFDLRSGDIFIIQEFPLVKRLENLIVSYDYDGKKTVNVDGVQLSCMSSGNNPESEFMAD